MKSRVLETVCDRCGTEENLPLPKDFDFGRVLLPNGWLHVSGVTTTTVVFSMDLCLSCKPEVLASAGTATRR